MNKDTSSDLASANGNDVMLSSVECGEVPRRPDRVKMASKENVFAFITFVIMGTAAMAFWNTLIVSIFSVQSFLYTDHPNISDTITAVYTTLSLVMTAALIRFQILNVKFLVLGALGFVISSFAYAFTCQTARGLTGVILFHVIAALAGSCTAFFESSMFGFASVLPRNYVGAATLGLGLSGLLASFGWMLFSKVLFPMSAEGVKSAVWLYLSCTAAVNILAIILFTIIFRLPWAVRCIRIAEAQRQEKNAAKDDFQKAKSAENEIAKSQNQSQHFGETSNLESQKKRMIGRTRLSIFNDAAEQIMNVSLTLWLTLMMFPNIAPLAFRRNVMETDILMGICQCGDFFGRYLPNLRKWIPYTVVRPKAVKYFTIARLVFVPFFILMFRLEDENRGILGTFWFQAICMFIFLFSSGWICSLSSMYVPGCVEDADEKGQAATMYLLCLLLGLTIGVWMSKLWKL